MKTLSYVSGNCNLLVNGLEIEFSTSKERNKEVIKLEKQGFQFPSNFINTDEFDGLCEASRLGFKTFECTILG